MQASTKPVDDSVSKINDEVAVGEDLEFRAQMVGCREVYLDLLSAADNCGFAGCFRTRLAGQSPSGGTGQIARYRLRTSGAIYCAFDPTAFT